MSVRIPAIALLLTLLGWGIWSLERAGAVTEDPWWVLDPDAVAADYLVVTADLFRPQAELLAAAIADLHGLRVVTISLAEIRVAFPGAMADSADTASIRDALAFAYANWRSAPLFALLIGDAAEAPSQIAHDLLPTPHFFQDEYGGWCDGTYAMDAWYGDVAGGTPARREIAIGRLPVRASAEIAAYQAELAEHFPQFAGLEIPSQLTNNVSLSTMHGCPPDEIERIARHLLVDRGLNTYVKLNPTLLGSETVHKILHDDLGFTEINVPDATFEHDLPYDRAVELIKSLQATAAEQGLEFGVKLSNTLPTVNHRDALPGEETYMSGRTLYPLTVNLFHKLSTEFNGDLNVSFSGGADALNVADLFRAGAKTVTSVTDLLKPGGYSRMLQYLENLEAAMKKDGAQNLDEFAKDQLAVLERLAAESLTDPRYKKSYQPYPAPKVASGLGWFDCVEAPCMAKCAVTQDVPE